jgi:beta-glucosidase
LVTEVLRANQNTIVVQQSGTQVEMPWLDEASSLLQVDINPAYHRIKSGLTSSAGFLRRKRAWQWSCRRYFRQGESSRQAVAEFLVSIRYRMNASTSERSPSKRLEDAPSHPSFGDKGQEYGKILYNEVRSRFAPVSRANAFLRAHRASSSPIAAWKSRT